MENEVEIKLGIHESWLYTKLAYTNVHESQCTSIHYTKKCNNHGFKHAKLYLYT